MTAALLYRGGPRDDVSEYIDEVNETQRDFSVRYGSIDRAFREFKLSPDAAANSCRSSRRPPRR